VCPKYPLKFICEISIFFFREINNTMIREFAIPFTKNLLKHLDKKNLMNKCFFSSYKVETPITDQVSISDHIFKILEMCFLKLVKIGTN